MSNMEEEVVEQPETVTPEKKVPVRRGKAANGMMPAGQITFQIDPKKHAQFGKMLKKLDRDVDAMLDYVKEVAQDAEASRETRLKAAQYYVDKAVELKKEVAKEVLTRQVAEVRMMQAAQPKKIVDVEEDNDMPQVRFEPSVILAVDATNI